MSSTPTSLQLLRQEMRLRGEATRPQLARACGLSLVTVNRMVKRLCAMGDLEAAGEVSSGGGRPVQLYRLRRTASQAALLRVARGTGGILVLRLELLDPLGTLLREEEARFAHLDEHNLSAWLHDRLRRSRRRLLSITIEAGSIPLPPELCTRLSTEHACPCRLVTVADALADEREATATLVLSAGSSPLCTLFRKGQRHSCGALELLPLPADWASLDDSDHTLVEEMVARLLLTLCCTLAPERFVLYGNFWSERLLHRIRYNLTTKLQGHSLPALRFRRLSAADTHKALHHLALEGA